MYCSRCITSVVQSKPISSGESAAVSATDTESDGGSGVVRERVMDLERQWRRENAECVFGARLMQKIGEGAGDSTARETRLAANASVLPGDAGESEAVAARLRSRQLTLNTYSSSATSESWKQGCRNSAPMKSRREEECERTP